jgi:hypothetical protein
MTVDRSYESPLKHRYLEDEEENDDFDQEQQEEEEEEEEEDGDNDAEAEAEAEDEENDNASSTTTIRATNCISFTVEPANEEFNALSSQQETMYHPSSYISEESFVFFSHRTYDSSSGYTTNGTPSYMINVRDWVTAFGVSTCSSLANYAEEVFGSADTTGIDTSTFTPYWGPICNVVRTALWDFDGQ